MNEVIKTVKTVAAVFELPQKLGILQYVEYEPPKEWCVNGCLYEGFLTAEGCRRGVCIKYRVRVFSRDKKRWEAKERWRWQRGELGGCLKQDVADALWELSGRYDVAVLYEGCYLVINGVKVSMPYHCSGVNECVERILEDYKREVEKLKEPPAVTAYNPAEELLRKYPELGAFGVEWVKAWAPHSKERLAEIAEVMRRFPWMVEVVRQRPVSNPHPHLMAVYVARDGSEVCLTLNPMNQPKTFCARDGAVKEVKLELDLVRYEVYEDRRRRLYRPKGLLAFSTASKEYIEIL